MGGKDEFKSEPVKQDRVVSSAGVKAGPVRIHENNGEVHFHDDKAKLKVAVSNSTIYSKFLNLETSPTTEPVVLLDPERNTQVRLEWVNKKGVWDLDIVVEEIDLGDNYRQLRKVIKGE